MCKLIVMLMCLSLLSGCSLTPAAVKLPDDSISLETADSILLEHDFSQVVIDHLLPGHRILLAENAVNSNETRIYQTDIAIHQPDDKLKLVIVSIKSLDTENDFLHGIEYHISSEWLKAPFLGNYDRTEIEYAGKMHTLTSNMHPFFNDYSSSAYVWDKKSSEWLLADSFKGDFESNKIIFNGIPTYKRTKYYTYFTMISDNLRDHGVNEMTLNYTHSLVFMTMDNYSLTHTIEY
ncbi:MAG: hypothetical protein IJN37_07445 [Clostridia bacterium]|nr:hypothetical protein [Clostridia bacterium]